MTYTVSGGMLNPTHSLDDFIRDKSVLLSVSLCVVLCLCLCV